MYLGICGKNNNNDKSNVNEASGHYVFEIGRTSKRLDQNLVKGTSLLRFCEDNKQTKIISGTIFLEMLVMLNCLLHFCIVGLPTWEGNAATNS